MSTCLSRTGAQNIPGQLSIIYTGETVQVAFANAVKRRDCDGGGYGVRGMRLRLW